MVTCTVQVTNVSPLASERQMKELFSYFGGIDEIRVYPEDDSLYSVPSKVCFVTFKERSSLETALHLTNTIFIDRALIVAQSRYEVIPDEDTALSLAAPAVAVAGPGGTPGGGGNGLLPTIGSTTPLLPTPGIPTQPSLLGAPSNALLQTPLSNALQQVQAAASSIAVATGVVAAPPAIAAQPPPVLTVAGSVIAQAPPITGNVDPTKIDEIRRTVYVGNLSTHLTADQVMHFFQPCGEIKYVRMAGDETQPTRFAFVEFTNPESVPIALQYNGALFGDRPVKVNHSKNAIVKPQGKTPELAQREVDEAMQKVREATMAISTAIEPPAPVPKRRSKFRSRTPSPNSPPRGRDKSHHTRSRSPGRRKSRSRSPGRRRSKSRSPRGRRRSSRSPRKKKSRSRSPRRKRSYSKSPSRYRRRSSSRSPRRRDSRDYYRGSYSRHRGGQSYYRHRSRTPDRERNRRRRRSHSRSRSPSPKRSSSRRSLKSYDERDHDHKRRRDRSASPSEHKKSHKKKSKKEKRHKRSRSPTPRDSLSPEQSDVESAQEEDEVGSRQSSDAEMVEERHDKDTSRSESDKPTSEDDE